jgi:hypothetical protein
VTREDLDGNQTFVLHDFLSGDECLALIRRGEELGYEPAPLGEALIAEARNNDRVIVDDLQLAADLFVRSRLLLPPVIDNQPLVGLNERFRLYRYDPGQRFKPHPDTSFARLERWEESLLTFLVYLNEQMEGGETRFYASMENVLYNLPCRSVRPKTGMALVFAHRIWHEGTAVRSGRKYVLRTDVMYGRPSLPE